MWGGNSGGNSGQYTQIGFLRANSRVLSVLSRISRPHFPLSAGDSKTTAPDGTPGTSTVQGNTDPNITTDGKSGGPIITIDNRTTAGETPGVLTHETVHAGESQKDPAKFAKDSKAEAGLPHDKRPQEQRAIAVQKAQGPAITKEVKRIGKERKKEQSQ